MRDIEDVLAANRGIAILSIESTGSYRSASMSELVNASGANSTAVVNLWNTPEIRAGLNADKLQPLCCASPV